MLPKKKRWTAAIRGSPPACQPSQHPSVPSTIPSPGKNQWTSHSPVLNSPSRIGPRHQSPPGSTLPPNQQPMSVNNTYQSVGSSIVSTSTAFALGGGTAGGHMSMSRPGIGGSDVGVKQCPSLPIRSTNELCMNNVNSLIPLSRTDFPAGLITAIANSTNNSNNAAELLQQQSELLLQILPQEYLLSYAQNIAKLTNVTSGNNNSNINNSLSTNHLKSVYDQAARVIASQSTLDPVLNAKPILLDTGAHSLPLNSCSSASSSSSSSCAPSVSSRSGQPLSSPHRPDSSDFPSTNHPIAFHTTLVSNSSFTGSQQHSIVSRPKPPEPVKVTRAANPGRAAPALTNSPVFSNSATSPSHRFSPSRRLSGSVDNVSGVTASHVAKVWPPLPPQPTAGQQPAVSVAHHPTQHQLPTVSYDLSTLSAVVRQAGLIPSVCPVSRMVPPNNNTTFVPQWDSATQLAFLSQQTGLTDSCGRKLSTGLLVSQPSMVSSASPSFGTSTTILSMHPGNGSVDSSNTHRFGGPHLDSKPRVTPDLPTNSSRLHTTPSSMKSGQESLIVSGVQSLPLLQQSPLGCSRRHSAKANLSGSGRASDMIDVRPGGTLLTPADQIKSYRATPPWLIADRRVDSQHVTNSLASVTNAQVISSSLSTTERMNPVESTDTRFAILQDAKMAALNVDWPIPPGSLSSSSSSSSNANKMQRIRSSSSFCVSQSPNLVHTTSIAALPTSSFITTAVSATTSTTTIPSISSISPIYTTTNPGSQSNSVIRISSSSPASSCSVSSLDDNRLSTGSIPSKPVVHPYTTQSSTRYTPLITNTVTPIGRTSLPALQSPVRTNSDYASLKTTPMVSVSLPDPNSGVHHKLYAPHTKPSPSPLPVPTLRLDVNTQPVENSDSASRPVSRTNQAQPIQIHSYPSTGSGDVFVKHQSITENRSVMPLKKRLIQRYEADNGTGPGSTSIADPRCSMQLVPSDSHSNSPHRCVHSPISPASQNSPYNNTTLPSGEIKPVTHNNNNNTGKPTGSSANLIPSDDKAKQLIESDPADSSSSSSSSSSSMKRKGNLNKMSRTKSSPTERTPPPPPPPPLNTSSSPPAVETTSSSTTTSMTIQQTQASTTKTSDIPHAEVPVTEQCQPALSTGTRRNGAVVGAKRGPLKGARKSTIKRTDKYGRASKSGGRFRPEPCGDDEKKTGRQNSRLSTPSTVVLSPQQPRRRPPADGARRTRRDSSSASSVTSWTRGPVTTLGEAPRRRVAAVNGTLLMMVAARAQRSNSSASASSCSLHSMEADASNDEVEDDEDVENGEKEDGDDQNVDYVMADESSHSVASSTASSRNAAVSRCSSSQRRNARSRPRPKSNKLSGLSGTIEPSSMLSHHVTSTAASGVAGGTISRAMPSPTPAHIPDTARTKKPKRAAALAASAATAASATVGTKRPRVGSKRVRSDGAKRRRRVRDRSESHQSQTEDEPATENEDNLMIDDESARATNDASSEITSLSKTESSTVLDELMTALMEDKIPINELINHLPGPPNLARLTENSLHPAHSLDYYKRTQIPFVQLVSCNDPGLKQVPKCRACRQLKVGAHYDASINGESGGGQSADDSSTAGEESVCSIRGSTTGASFPAASSKDGQFKRPANGRSSQLDKTGHELEKSRDRDKLRSKKIAGTGTTSSSSMTNSNTSSHSDPSGGGGGGGVNSPVSVFCRFWGFRKLTFNNRGLLKLADFCHSTEASADDRSLWEMHHPISPPLSVSAARYILERSGTLFCRLLRQELAILTGNRNRDQPLPRGPGAPPKKGALSKRSGAVNSLRLTSFSTSAVAWKRPVKGVREMCDVCETTMFNTHWVCGKCGYSVCVHCCEEAKARQKEAAAVAESDEGNTDETVGRDRNRLKHSKARGASLMGWSSCTTTRQHHGPDRLLLTALLPASTVGRLLHRVHRIARHYQIRLGCGCLPNETEVTSATDNPSVNENPLRSIDMARGGTVDNSSLDLLADLALQTGMTTSTLKKCEESIKKEDNMRDGLVSEALLYDRRSGIEATRRSLDSTSVGVPLPPHTWIHKPDQHSSPVPRAGSDHTSGIPVLADGESANGPRVNPKYRVLQLHHPDSPGTLLAFQHEWRQNRPVIVSGCQDKFDASLWTPRRFAEDFGSLRTPLVDCATGVELTRYPLRTFWEGFERKSKRVMNKDGRAYCLKLKDWPTTDDFAELQPNRFSDLMNNLPMPEYTCRDGQLNLASRLASFFVCPDLGPKLYVAYGTGGSRSMGTTNLHVDIADAINILLYVGHPSDTIEESTANAEAVLNVMRLAKVDRVFVDRATAWNRRIQCSGLQQSPRSMDARVGLTDCGPPGALWHIFLPEDMPALRGFLTQITEEESGAPLEPGSDPIHDQLFYLDQPLLDRLYSCTGILPCTIVQFHGDAVFIPAGAAHQVRNLNSCIKAAVDFVSPEHLPQCFQLIEEFRRLSNTHQNHEDKLQVKNMLFHAVKDALSVVLSSDPPVRLPTCKSLRPKLASDNEHDDDGEETDEEGEEENESSLYNCAISELFDADRLASTQLIRPSLLLKSENLDESEHKPGQVPSRTRNSPTASGLEWITSRTKSTSGGNNTRINKAGRTRLPTTLVGSQRSSPSSLLRSPSRPQSTGSDQLISSGSQVKTSPSPSSTIVRCNLSLPPSSPTTTATPVTNTTTTAAAAAAGRSGPYDAHYLMDASGLAAHRNTADRGFVVSGSQPG